MRSLLLALMLPVSAWGQTAADPEIGTGFAAGEVAVAERHMIAAANPLAAEAGLEMLRAGGTAADALIAAQLVLGVVEPQSSGIGGGAFALVHVGGELTTWDGRETAPAGATPGMFLDAAGEPMDFLDAVASGRSVGVPGVPRLLEALHREYGRLPWADLFAPAIRLAEEGFVVSPRLSDSIAAYGLRLLASDSEPLFLKADGAPHLEGDLLRQPELAATMRAMAAGGADAFYSGETADAIVAAVARGPVSGTMTGADLAGYRVVERAPLCVTYREAWEVCSMGPPSSGATTVGQMLGLLSAFPPPDGAGDAGFWHLFAEASRLAYADRAAYLADADFVAVPAQGLLEPGYLAERAALIDPAAAGEAATAGTPPWREGRYGPDPSLREYGTSHVSVIDGDGLAIALTTSIETAFGSGRMANGVLLNNQLTDFSFRPVAEGHPVANAAAAGKRPRSSMSPTMVFEAATGRLVAITGSPGGSRIPEYVAQSVVGLLDLGLDPVAAASLPHVSHRNGGLLVLEPSAPDALAEALAGLGHEVDRRELVSGLHIITIGPDGTMTGGADPRREGVALGD